MTKERHYPSGSLRGAPKGISLFKKIFIFIYLYIWLGFPGGLISKESACNAGDLGSIPGLGRSPGKIPWRRDRLPTPVFWPEEFHGLYSPCTQSRTRLSDFHFHIFGCNGS